MAVKGTETTVQDLKIGYTLMKVKKVDFQTNNDKSFVVFTLYKELPNKTLFFTNASFYVKPEVNKSSKVDADGKSKVQFIDQYSNTMWSLKPEDKEYNGELKFEAKSARPCGVGEEALMGFVKSYLNPTKGSECRFDSFKAIANGDLTEVQAAIEAYPNNNVGVMLGVRDKKYQAVYTGKFERGFVKGEPKNIIKALKNDDYTKLFFGAEPFPFMTFDVDAAPAPNDPTPPIEDSPIDLQPEIAYTNTLSSMIPEGFPENNEEIVLPF